MISNISKIFLENASSQPIQMECVCSSTLSACTYDKNSLSNLHFLKYDYTSLVTQLESEISKALRLFFLDPPEFAYKDAFDVISELKFDYDGDFESILLDRLSKKITPSNLETCCFCKNEISGNSERIGCDLISCMQCLKLYLKTCISNEHIVIKCPCAEPACVFRIYPRLVDKVLGSSDFSKQYDYLLAVRIVTGMNHKSSSKPEGFTRVICPYYSCSNGIQYKAQKLAFCGYRCECGTRFCLKHLATFYNQADCQGAVDFQFSIQGIEKTMQVGLDIEEEKASHFDSAIVCENEKQL